MAEDVDFARLGLRHGTTLRIILNKKNKTRFCTTESEGIVEATRESAQP